jgi:hypothetical protein
MLGKLIILAFCYCYLNLVLANSPIEKFRKEIIGEGETNNKMEYFETKFSILNGKLHSESYNAGRYIADFSSVNGHVFAYDTYTNQQYDSSSGAGAVEKQWGGTCPINTYDNLFYLRTMGDVYYTEFSRKLRPTKDFYLFYTFIVMYDAINKEIIENEAKLLNNKALDKITFKNFNVLIEKKWSLQDSNNPSIGLPSWLNSLPVGLLSEIAKEAGVSMNSEDNLDFLKMAEMVFTNIKNREGLYGKFSFEEDAPHLMKFFGYSDEVSRKATEKHLKNYFIYNTNYMNTTVNGYSTNSMGIDEVLITRESLIFLEYFSMFYDIYEQNASERIKYVSMDTENRGFNFRLLRDSKLMLLYPLPISFASKHSSSFLALATDFCFEEAIREHSKIGILLSFYLNSIIFNSEIRNLLTMFFDNLSIYNLAIGGYYKRIFSNWDIHLSSGVLLDFTSPSGIHNLEDKFDFDFKDRNVTVFVRGQRTFSPRIPLLPTMVLAIDLVHSWFHFYDIVARKKFTNYSIENNDYHLINLNLSVDLIKNITPDFSISMYFMNVNYLNKPANGFVLKNRTYENLSLETNPVIDMRNNFFLGFKLFHEMSRVLGSRISLEIGYDLNLDDISKNFWNFRFLIKL